MARGVLLVVLAIVACAGPMDRTERSVPNLYDTQGAITEYIDSGRYDADVARVAAEALAWLEARAPEVERPAIVLDVDETVLSNWPAYRVNGWARILGVPATSNRAPAASAPGRRWGARRRSRPRRRWWRAPASSA